MIAIIDYGVGNLFSLRSSLDMIGAEAVVTSNADEIRKCKKCGKDFIVVKKFQALGFNHFVDIVCPYCNQVVDSSLFFYVDTFRIGEGESESCD